MGLLRTVFTALAAVIGANAATGSLQQVTDSFGPNPNNVGFYYYKPSQVASKPALIVAIHWCTGSAQDYFQYTQYATLADNYGYVVIYPDAPRDTKCFDVNTPETLSHNGGGDSQGIASMVKYAINNWGADANRVFVTGTSSGAMMTNVMAGSYPELFQAGSAYSGVPFACFAGSNAWNSDCSTGQISLTGQQWGDLVRAAYPGYSGSRPRMMLWHGTEDTGLDYANLKQEILEWTNVLGVSSTPTTTTLNDPQSNYTHTSYGCVVQAYSAAGVGHTVPVHESIDLQWFGITPGGPSCVGGTTSTTTTRGVTTASTTSRTSTTTSRTSTTTSRTSNTTSRTSPTTSRTSTTTSRTSNTTSRTSTTTSRTSTTTSRTSTSTSPTTSTSTSSTTSTSTTSIELNCSPKWGQCGGQGWTGPTCCQSGSTCQYSNPWHSQCL